MLHFTAGEYDIITFFIYYVIWRNSAYPICMVYSIICVSFVPYIVYGQIIITSLASVTVAFSLVFIGFMG